MGKFYKFKNLLGTALEIKQIVQENHTKILNKDAIHPFVNSHIVLRQIVDLFRVYLAFTQQLLGQRPRNPAQDSADR